MIGIVCECEYSQIVKSITLFLGRCKHFLKIPESSVTAYSESGFTQKYLGKMSNLRAVWGIFYSPCAVRSMTICCQFSFSVTKRADQPEMRTARLW